MTLDQAAIEGLGRRVKWVERVNHSTRHGPQRNSNRQQFNNFKDKKLFLTQTRRNAIMTALIFFIHTQNHFFEFLEEIGTR
jgi:hypothetical protein